jgi:hypothetical protein
MILAASAWGNVLFPLSVFKAPTSPEGNPFFPINTLARKPLIVQSNLGSACFQIKTLREEPVA